MMAKIFKKPKGVSPSVYRIEPDKRPFNREILTVFPSICRINTFSSRM